MQITIGLAQTYPVIGNVQANLTHHLKLVETAHQQGVDLLIFPELSLTGYQLQDLVPSVAISTQPDDPIFAQLLNASHQLDIVFSFVHRDNRDRFFIASAYLSQGACLHLHHKVYLPTYTLFDEGRYFDAGETIRAFDTRWGRMGILLCEDFWHVSPPYLLWLDGANILLLQSASPSRGISTDERTGSTKWVETVNQTYASLFTNYVVHCNRVGYEDGKNFWGGSSIVNPNGEFLMKAPYFDEALITQTIDLNQIHRTRTQLPLLRDERPDLVQRELARILGHNKDEV